MMPPYGHYFYAQQRERDAAKQRPEGGTKAAAPTRKSSREVWSFLQLVAVTIVIIAAVFVLTSLGHH